VAQQKQNNNKCYTKGLDITRLRFMLDSKSLEQLANCEHELV